MQEEWAGEPRVVVGEGALRQVGREAAALGSRALLISPATPEPRLVALLGEIAASLREARVGRQPFPRVPRAGAPLAPSFAPAAEAAREGRCRLVIGLGDERALDVARAAAASAWVPCLLVPTGVGYGAPLSSPRLPMPDVLVLDPAAALGSPPRRTAGLGLSLFAALIERYAARPAPEPDLRETAERALRLLVDDLPRAVRDPDQPGPRAGLAEATGRSAEVLGVLGPGDALLGRLVSRVRGSGDAVSMRAALLPAALEACSGEGAILAPEAVARFGRTVLGIREEDDGRAALWAAGGVRQWVRNLGFGVRLPPGARVAGAEDEATREILAAARR